jgi:hypothetical protein
MDAETDVLEGQEQRGRGKIMALIVLAVDIGYEGLA